MEGLGKYGGFRSRAEYSEKISEVYFEKKRRDDKMSSLLIIAELEENVQLL
jgi:hypothetical protein